MRNNIYDTGLKVIGTVLLDAQGLALINTDVYSTFIRILFIPGGVKIQVDIDTFTTTSPTLVFISPDQLLRIDSIPDNSAFLLYYNRDFYCIQLNDKQVACDGLLFSQFNRMRLTPVPNEEAAFIRYLIGQVNNEFALKDPTQEEMLRTYLKQLLIKSTRFWRQQFVSEDNLSENKDLEFFRKFMQLVEVFYKEKHSVADYAVMMNVAPKTLTHRFKRLNLPQPGEVIKNRIILEAKRLLIYTERTAKEIAYGLGYDDPAYFSRIFQIKTNRSPSGFRESYLLMNTPVKHAS